MSALNACLKVANIAEASGVPYVENVAKVAVVVFKLLEVRLAIVSGMTVIADSVPYSKRERTRRVPRNSVRVLQTRLSSSTLSSVCKENGELHVISIFAGRWKGELPFSLAVFLQQLNNGLVIGILKAWRKISRMLHSSTVASKASSVSTISEMPFRLTGGA